MLIMYTLLATSPQFCSSACIQGVYDLRLKLTKAKGQVENFRKSVEVKILGLGINRPRSIFKLEFSQLVQDNALFWQIY